MRVRSALFSLALFSATAVGQQTMTPDGAGGWIIQGSPASNFSGFYSAGSSMPGTQAVINEQNARLRQEQIQNQQLQNQLLIDQHRQNELIRNQQIENERLRRELEQERSGGSAQPQQ